ncbi:MAG: LysR family transcriptional regulator, partial [Leuconostoc citreum]|nr:LysR family transcriptional regulator [Leuconostoc citreum]
MFKLLQTFVAVYETRSFSKAAAQRFISQPTVSVHIQQLEKELGAQLFHR